MSEISTAISPNMWLEFYSVTALKIRIKFQKIQYTFCTFKIALLKKIINIVKFYATFVTYKFCKFPNILNSVVLRYFLLLENSDKSFKVKNWNVAHKIVI